MASISNQIQFETPENILVSYQVAGLGTRFIAWFLDWIFALILGIALILGALLVGVSLDVLSRDLFDSNTPDEALRSMLILAGLAWVAFAFSSVIYFGLSEYFMRGQTIGKRHMEIRVVKTDGFSLDAQAVLLRSIFRFVDHIPIFWIVPIVSEKGQRLGDFVASTVVVQQSREAYSDMRQALVARPIDESKFRFDGVTLNRARPQDVRAIEQILQRWNGLSPQDRQNLLDRIVKPLATRLQVEAPDPADEFNFLVDFLAAECRRQYRKLG